MRLALRSSIHNLPWPASPSEAIALQKRLAGELILQGDLSGVDLVAGVDVSSVVEAGLMVGAVVIWSLNRGMVTCSTTATAKTTFPYIPGLLAFRELPVLLEAFKRLPPLSPPLLRRGGSIDAVICDGQGTAHPRGFGIACHLGLYLGVPSVGCAKSRLTGWYEEPGLERGAQSPLWDRKLQTERRNSALSPDRVDLQSSIYNLQSEIGRVVRTRTGVKPVFVSPGHLVGFDEAVQLVLRACTRYRLPEPVRAAHRLATETAAGMKLNGGL